MSLGPHPDPKQRPKAEPGISPEKLFAAVGFKPHSQGQSDYLFSKKRFNVPCCGRRYGKSQAAGHRMTLKSFKPNTWNWIVGTSYRIGEKEFRVVWDDYDKLGLLPHCKKSYSQHQGDMYIETPWKSHIMVVSADNQDSLVGEGLSHAIMSEAAKHNRSTWEQFIEPALSDHRGSCDFPSTPHGFNWFHGLFMLGQEAMHMPASEAAKLGMDQYAAFHFPTWENTARFPGGRNDPEILRVEKVASDIWFRQEYGAEFTATTGSIYDDWDDNKHIIEHYQFNPAWPNYLAFDYGYANPFVCLDIQVSPSDDVFVWREYYKSQLSTTEHAMYLANRGNPKHPDFDSPPGYKIDGMWGDPRGADEAATIALYLGLVAGPDVRWKLSVEQIKRLLKSEPPKLYVHKSCVNLTRQMAKLHVKERGKNAVQDLQEQIGDGNIQHKVDDHAADALRYFIGPYYVLGGNTSLVDIYGENYKGSESEDFFTLRTSVGLNDDDMFSIAKQF